MNEWNVVSIEQDKALQFLRDNHADREVIFIRPCDQWIAVYDEDSFPLQLVGVTGINFKKNHMSVDCSFVRADYRRRGILKTFYAWIMEHYPNANWVIYCRPYAAHIVKKYYGFKVTQTWENGTEKCVLRK